MRRGVVAAGAAGRGLVGGVVVVVAGREAVMGAGAVVVLRVCVRVAHWAIVDLPSGTHDSVVLFE